MTNKYGRTMKNVSIKILVLLAGAVSAASASDLPDCPTNESLSWNNCFGTLFTPGGGKYVGEWKGDKPNGQGARTYPNGYKYVGEWKDGVRNGQGTAIDPDGTIENGIWKNDKFLGTVTEVEAEPE